MVDVGWKVKNGKEVSAWFKTKSVTAAKSVVGVTRMYGQLLVTRIQANVSTGTHPPGAPHIPGTGPGPNVATGDYRRSWNLQMDVSAFRVRARAGTNNPQGRRLEFGFHGYDSLGRYFDQPPYPHAEPALDWIAPQYFVALGAIPELNS